MSSAMPLHPTESLSESAAAERKAERMLWWFALGGATVSVVIGVLVLVWPHATLLVGAALFGIWLLVHGIVHLVQAITATASDVAVRTLNGVIGVLFIVGGVVCVRNAVTTLLLVATIIGITWLIAGVVQLMVAFSAGRSTQSRVLVGTFGALAILGGVVVLVWPDLTLLTMVYLTGIWLLVMGLFQFVLVLRARPAVAG
jgi:uncharacterized membrane protein HdeD (DUF308 family)